MDRTSHCMENSTNDKTSCIAGIGLMSYAFIVFEFQFCVPFCFISYFSNEGATCSIDTRGYKGYTLGSDRKES